MQTFVMAAPPRPHSRKESHKDYWIEGYGGQVYSRTQWLGMLRRASGLTNKEAGERIGITNAAVSMFMSGRSIDPHMETIRAYASVYGEGIWAAYGFVPVGWMRGRVRTTIEYGDRPVERWGPDRPRCVLCGKPVARYAKIVCGTYHRRVWQSERQRAYYWRRKEREARG